MANIRDLAIGQVLTAPSPATTGTTLVLNSGQGADMPTTTPFKVLAYPSNALPTKNNSEILLVTGVSGDTLTFVRAQGETTTAKSIAVGWLVSNNVFTSDINNTGLVRNETPVGLINGTNAAFTVASPYTTGSLRVYKNGIRLKAGASNDYTESAAGFMMTTAPATGTTLLVDYEIGSTSFTLGTNSLVTDETVAGTQNGTNTVFTTTRQYIATSLEVFLNGIRQIRGVDFTETTPASGIFTMTNAPLATDFIRVNYQFNLNPSSNADTVDGIHASTTPTAGQLFPLVAKTTDANGWTKYDYGLWQEYRKTSTTTDSLAASGWHYITLSNLPVGMATLGSNHINVTGLPSDSAIVFAAGATPGAAVISASTSNQYGGAINNFVINWTATIITP